MPANIAYVGVYVMNNRRMKPTSYTHTDDNLDSYLQEIKEIAVSLSWPPLVVEQVNTQTLWLSQLQLLLAR